MIRNLNTQQSRRSTPSIITTFPVTLKAVIPCKKPATKTPMPPFRMLQAVAMSIHTPLASAFEATAATITLGTTRNEGNDAWFANLSPRRIRDG
ncbi:hypothetical protein M378DRAFT_807999 [Amanita muscaria Koide BX008]|uniref:Uncharacterized protein n=1 Tax=Amanita muscaria (strain Koide BX008) TaxID=946122 RepID=A0A0C2WKJ0_AMAMK|nr:hypothetical protein M378DRAFT_807999 [Amanita muscaria Koide BX008]